MREPRSSLSVDSVKSEQGGLLMSPVQHYLHLCSSVSNLRQVKSAPLGGQLAAERHRPMKIAKLGDEKGWSISPPGRRLGARLLQYSIAAFEGNVTAPATSPSNHFPDIFERPCQESQGREGSSRSLILDVAHRAIEVIEQV